MAIFKFFFGQSSAAAAVFTPVANAFRFYADGTESGSTPLAVENANLGSASYPVSTIGNDWTLVPGGGSAHEKVDDFAVPDDSDYLYAELNAFFTTTVDADLNLAGVQDPASSAEHVIVVRIQCTEPGDFPDGNGLDITLYQGAGTSTTVADFFLTASSLTSSFADYTYTLSGAEADAITDYSTLHLNVGASCDGSEIFKSFTVAVSRAYLRTTVKRDVSADSKVHLRVRLQETGGASGVATDDYGLQYRKNGGTWTSITASSSGVQADTASSLTDGSATTNRGTNGISDGTGSFVAGEQEEANGVIEDFQLTASNFTELVWALKLIAADLADDDLLEFRVTLNGGSPGISQTVTPSIAVLKLAAISGTGALASQAAVLDGAGLSASISTDGAIAAQSATASSAGISSSNSTDGAISAQSASLDGTGTAGSVDVEGDGALLSQAAVVDGAGISLSSGSGALLAQGADVTGTGLSVTLSTDGAILAQSATTDGSALSITISTDGAISAQASDVSGAGASSSSSTDGAIAAQSATAAGLGAASSSGAGALVAAAANASGAAISRSLGTGVLIAGAAQIDGSDVASITGVGSLVAQHATVQGVGVAADFVEIHVGPPMEMPQPLRLIKGRGTLRAPHAKMRGAGEVSWESQNVNALLLLAAA